jgi:hypothetical protein
LTGCYCGGGPLWSRSLTNSKTFLRWSIPAIAPPSTS